MKPLVIMACIIVWLFGAGFTWVNMGTEARREEGAIEFALALWPLALGVIIGGESQ